MFVDTLFYLFSTLLILCAGGVVFTRNTLYSVLFLIMAFFNASGLFLLAGAEFLAMIMVIVYVGAVAVLFLFVVMMIDSRKDHTALQLKHFRGGMIVAACIFALELLVVCFHWTGGSKALERVAFSTPRHLTNSQALGELLYTHYFFVFQISGLILLTAMIGAIILTLPLERRRLGRKQDIAKQLRRKKQQTLTIKRVEFRRGLK
jgi:NADH-quinone oxidoreductase subunit J